MQKEPKFFDMKRCSDLIIKQKIFELALLISTIDIDIDIQIYTDKLSQKKNCIKHFNLYLQGINKGLHCMVQ